MPHRLFSCLLSALLVCACGQVSAAKQNQEASEQLLYGDILFNFYKEDYFAAITRLMAAQERKELQHHAQDAAILLGRLELSYGMPDEARKQFLNTMNTAINRDVRNRIWYNLGKDAYQHGRYDQARNDLLKLKTAPDSMLTAELALLLANTEMNLGENQSAANRLQNINAPENIAEYLRFNRGIAFMRLGWVESGREALEVIGLTQTKNPELRALRDQANLSLGYGLLHTEHPDRARTFFNRVRLNGPYAPAALLGAGWADAERGDFENALTPWLELINRDHFDAAVQEAHLAVPFAFEKLKDDTRAIYYYKAAITFFDKEQNALKSTSQAVERDLLNRLSRQFPHDFTGNWLDNINPNLEIEDIPGAPYLIEVLAGNKFQEQLKNYRNLSYLKLQLEHWGQNTGRLRDIVDTRRQAYEQRSPGVYERLALNETGTLELRLNEYKKNLVLLEKQHAPLALATARERQQWDKLESIQARITAYDDNPQLQQLANRTRLLKGLLYWQIQDDYPKRLLNIKNLLRETEVLIREARSRQTAISTALKDTKTWLTAYDNRIDQLQTRIQLLYPEVQQAFSHSGIELKSIALKSLMARNERLSSYRNQANYALARIYDRLSQGHNSKSNEDWR